MLASQAFASDPAVAFDRLGVAYAAEIQVTSNLATSVVVHKKAPGAASWSAGTTVTAINPDKEFITADLDPNSPCKDNVYVGWDNNENAAQTLRVAHSSNGGTSFTTSSKINHS